MPVTRILISLLPGNYCCGLRERPTGPVSRAFHLGCRKANFMRECPRLRTQPLRSRGAGRSNAGTHLRRDRLPRRECAVRRRTERSECRPRRSGGHRYTAVRRAPRWAREEWLSVARSAFVSRSAPGNGTSGRASRMRRISRPNAVKARRGTLDEVAQLGFCVAGFSSGMMRRSMRNVTRSGTTLVLMPPSIRPTLTVGCVMPGMAERRVLKRLAAVVDGLQNAGRARPARLHPTPALPHGPGGPGP